MTLSSSFMKLVEGRRAIRLVEESSSLMERERESRFAKRGLFFLEDTPLSVVEPTFLIPNCEFLSSDCSVPIAVMLISRHVFPIWMDGDVCCKDSPSCSRETAPKRSGDDSECLEEIGVLRSVELPRLFG